MFSAGTVLECPKITKNGKFTVILFIHYILLKLGQKSQITNTYVIWPWSTIEKLNFVLQIKVPKKPSIVKKFYKLTKLTKVSSWGLHNVLNLKVTSTSTKSYQIPCFGSNITINVRAKYRDSCIICRIFE